MFNAQTKVCALNSDAASFYLIFFFFCSPFIFLNTPSVLKSAESPDFLQSQSSSQNFQCNLSASEALSGLSFLEILSDTQQIFEEATRAAWHQSAG